MKNFRKYKWFWAALGSWFFFASLTSWAVIFSPLNIASKVFSEFTVQINGQVENNKFLQEESPLGQTLAAITAEWEADGWKNISGDLNLATVFLGTTGESDEALSSLAQLRLFQNDGTYKLLGLFRDLNHGQTYHWISEIPKTAFQNPEPAPNDFPLRPPQEAKNVSLIKSKKTESLTWSVIKTNDFEGKFHALCLSQGFTEKTDGSPARAKGKIYLLKMKNALIMTTLLVQGKNFTISMVKVTGN